MNWELDTLDGWTAYRESMESISEGFWRRWRPRIMTHLYYQTKHGKNRLRYQFGYEIHGYGTVVGHCRHHRPHRTMGGAGACRDRFLAGKPDIWWNRLPWMREYHG